MATLDPDLDHVVLINTFIVKPGRADDLVAALTEATEKGIRNAPGFISANLHVSLDGSKVVNYAQWRSAEDFEAMRSTDSFKRHAQQTMDLIEKFEPVLYKLRYSHGRQAAEAEA